MSLDQLQARIKQSGATSAVIVSMFRGNPGELSYIDHSGKELLNIRLESAALRREVSPDSSTKNTSCLGIAVKEDSDERTIQLANFLSRLLGLESFPVASPYDVSPITSNHSFLWIEDLKKGKTLWTVYLTDGHVEIGPRMRITSFRSD